jgi:hypothetical protein
MLVVVAAACVVRFACLVCVAVAAVCYGLLPTLLPSLQYLRGFNRPGFVQTHAGLLAPYLWHISKLRTSPSTSRPLHSTRFSSQRG